MSYCFTETDLIEGGSWLNLIFFFFQVDEETNYKTKSILCMPIKNAQGRVIGVAQLINKLDGTSFNKNDQNLFEVINLKKAMHLVR